MATSFKRRCSLPKSVTTRSLRCMLRPSLVSGTDTFKGIGILLLYLITVVVRNVAEPKVIGGQMGINPLFTLLAMFAGLKLFGFWGLFMFPIALIVIIKYYKNEMEREKE